MHNKGNLYRTITTDDLDIEGESIHVGETVTFMRKISARQLLRISQARDLENKADAIVELVTFIHDEICPMLSKAITSWTWLDIFDGSSLGEYPTVDILRDLAIEEVLYLMNKWIEVAVASGTEKNPPQPSSDQS